MAVADGLTKRRAVGGLIRIIIMEQTINCRHNSKFFSDKQARTSDTTDSYAQVWKKHKETTQTIKLKRYKAKPDNGT